LVLQFKTVNYAAVRLAMTTVGYDATHPSVMSLQWDNNGTWDLGILDLSLLYVDHVTPASGHDLYMWLANGYSMLWQYPAGTTVASLNYLGQLALGGNYINLLPYAGTQGVIDFKRSDDWQEASIQIQYAGAYGGNLVIYLHPNDGILGTACAERMRLTSAGSLTISGNITICGRVLYDDGSYLRSSSDFVADHALVCGHLAGSGTRAVYSDLNGTLTNTASSKRYKENIRNLADCSWIYDLTPVMFNWIDKKAQGEGDFLGLITEDVMALSPQLAFTNLKGEPEGVHYEMLAVPMLVEMKKLKAEVEDLRSQIKILKGGVSA
jgi:hypothetical protein